MPWRAPQSRDRLRGDTLRAQQRAGNDAQDACALHAHNKAQAGSRGESDFRGLLDQAGQQDCPGRDGFDGVGDDLRAAGGGLRHEDLIGDRGRKLYADIVPQLIQAARIDHKRAAAFGRPQLRVEYVQGHCRVRHRYAAGIRRRGQVAGGYGAHGAGGFVEIQSRPIDGGRGGPRRAAAAVIRAAAVRPAAAIWFTTAIFLLAATKTPVC